MLVRIPAQKWIILVRIPARRWIILVRIYPLTWIMLVRMPGSCSWEMTGHGGGCVMRAYSDALSDDREGEPQRSSFDQSTTEPATPGVPLVLAEVGNLPC